jgi:solute carrier family 35, member F5
LVSMHRRPFLCFQNRLCNLPSRWRTWCHQDSTLECWPAHSSHATPLLKLRYHSVQVAPLWYFAQLLFNASLKLTSVTSNTILSSTSALFTLAFSAAALAEPCTLRKVGYILLLVAGTAMVTLADSEAAAGGDATSINGTLGDDGGSGSTGDNGSEGAKGVLGDMLCLLSAALYAAYTVTLRRLLGEDEGVAMTLFFGLMGCAIFLGMGAPLLVLKAAGADLGSLSWRVLGMMVAKGLADNVLSDYLWARAILLVGEDHVMIVLSVASVF